MSIIDHKDPVCGMEVNPDNAAAKSERDGQSYYFCSEHCSEHCKEKFERSPEQYTRQTA